MYQKGSVILQVKSSLQMTRGLHGQSKLALCNQTIRCNLRILACELYLHCKTIVDRGESSYNYVS